jgi:hypothetical protein
MRHGDRSVVAAQAVQSASPTQFTYPTSGGTISLPMPHQAPDTYNYQSSGDAHAETDTGAGTTNTTSCGSLSNVSTCNGFDQQTRLGSATIHSGTQLYNAPVSARRGRQPGLPSPAVDHNTAHGRL